MNLKEEIIGTLEDIWKFIKPFVTEGEESLITGCSLPVVGIAMMVIAILLMNPIGLILAFVIAVICWMRYVKGK